MVGAAHRSDHLGTGGQPLGDDAVGYFGGDRRRHLAAAGHVQGLGPGGLIPGVASGAVLPGIGTIPTRHPPANFTVSRCPSGSGSTVATSGKRRAKHVVRAACSVIPASSPVILHSESARPIATISACWRP